MVTNLETLRKELTAINDEISVATPVQANSYQAGLIVFQPRQGNSEKWIKHADTEVIGYIAEGEGRLRLPNETAPAPIYRCWGSEISYLDSSTPCIGASPITSLLCQDPL